MRVNDVSSVEHLYLMRSRLDRKTDCNLVAPTCCQSPACDDGVVLSCSGVSCRGGTECSEGELCAQCMQKHDTKGFDCDLLSHRLAREHSAAATLNLCAHAASEQLAHGI